MKKNSIIAVLVLVISLLIIPSICFADVAGSYSLTSVYVTMIDPTINSAPSYDLKAGSNINVTNVVWKDYNGKTLTSSDKFSTGAYTLSFDLERTRGDVFASRTTVYINNSSNSVEKTLVNSSKLSVTKTFAFRSTSAGTRPSTTSSTETSTETRQTSSGRLSDAHGKADYFEDGPASTTTTDDGKKVVSNINVIVDGNVEEGKALPTKFQANSDIQKTFVTYNISKTTPSDTTKPYGVWQQYDETAQAGKSYTVRIVIPLSSDITLSDDFRFTLNGTPVSNPKAGLMGNLFQDYTYKVGETKPAASIINYITKVEFEDYTFPVAGQEYNAQDVKLKSTVPGEITKARFVMFNKDLTGQATLGDNTGIEVTVKANSSYEFSSDVTSTLAGVEAQIEKVSATEYKFSFSYKVVEGTTIKIEDQSPETLEFKEGEDVKLFVKATGVESYQWNKIEVTTGGGAKAKYTPSKIDGATSSEYIIEKASKDLDGAQYRCTLTAKDKSVAYTKEISLKLVEKSEETKPEEKKEEEKVQEITWAKASSWAIDELDKANKAGLIPAIFDKEDLTKNVTRKEFAHIAVKLYEKVSGKKAEKASKNPFTDTKDEEVLKAYNVGITQGTSETTFAPDNEITREQMATMMTRALSEAGIDTKVDLAKVEEFVDDNEMHNWSRSAIYFMSDAGIIKGVSTTENRYGVKGTATREQSLLVSIRSAEKFTK